MPTFHITGQMNRDLSNDELAALPDGWTRNPEQHHYVQAYDIEAARIGDALRSFDDRIVEASRSEPALECASASVRAAPGRTATAS